MHRMRNGLVDRIDRMDRYWGLVVWGGQDAQDYQDAQWIGSQDEQDYPDTVRTPAYRALI